jgi:hypothetical protein
MGAPLGNAEHLLIVVPCPLVVTTAMELADRAL